MRLDSPFTWKSVSEFFRASSSLSPTESGTHSLGFRHLAGDLATSSLFCVDEGSLRRELSDQRILSIIETYGPNLSNVAHHPRETINHLDYTGSLEYAEEQEIGSSGVLRRSLEVLASASSLYRQFPGATVSISVTGVPIFRAAHILRQEISLPAKFACIAIFETGSLSVLPEQLSSIMALSSGNSIYAANALLQDPLKPNLHGPQGITRIVGNIDRPGVVMLAPPQAPRLRPDEPGAWRVINHSNFDGSLDNCFPETSLHLSFTEYEIPLSVPIGAKDATVSIVETLISAHNRQSWIADLDIIASLRSEKLFRRLSPPHCKHEKDCPRPPIESAVTQIGRVSGKRLVSINSWEELLDPPPGLDASTIGVVRAFDNWHARVATMSVSVQKALRTVVLPTEPLCTVCGDFKFVEMGAFAQILIS